MPKNKKTEIKNRIAKLIKIWYDLFISNDIYMLNKILDFFKRNKIVSRQTLFKYGVPGNLVFNTEETPDGSLVITCETLPGFITMAKSIHQLPRAISEAVLCYFDIPNQEGNLLPGAIKHKEFEFVIGREQVLAAA